MLITIGDIPIRIQVMQKKQQKDQNLMAPTKRKFLIDFNASETKTSIFTSKKKNLYIIKFKIKILVTYIFKKIEVLTM